jgi:photosystem II stability/assembly factor-like uncharacterized protein
VRTIDGGATWNAMVVPGADTLQFRDVHAFSATSALVMSIGNGGSSRVYRTDDAGTTWTKTFENADPDAFYDCLAFWDDQHGIAFSDASGSRFPIIRTADGGRTWTLIPAIVLPEASPGEGSFASSGTCVVTIGERSAWIGTGNASPARVLRTHDRGATWSASTLPIVSGSAKGTASVAARDGRNGVALGGDIGAPTVFTENVARTGDGGATWTLGNHPPFAGAIYGGVYVPGTRTLVVVGPGGAASSPDDGATWTALSNETYWGIGFASKRAGWFVGPAGRITRVSYS